MRSLSCPQGYRRRPAVTAPVQAADNKSPSEAVVVRSGNI